MRLRERKAKRVLDSHCSRHEMFCTSSHAIRLMRNLIFGKSLIHFGRSRRLTLFQDGPLNTSKVVVDPGRMAHL